MKRFLILTVLSISLFYLVGCSDSSTGNNDGFGSTSSYTTANVKTAGTQYFSFSDASATSTKPQVFDIRFTLEQRDAVVGDGCTYFRVNADPIMIAGPGVSLARVDAASLDDVTEVPAAEAFMADDSVSAPLIGKTWFDQSYDVLPDVYVFKTCAGNYGLLAIESYEMDFTKMQISSIKWNYKYNADGSMDFTSTPLDSFRTGNAYDEARFWSFAEGALPMAYGTWEVMVDGSSIWLGPNVQVYKEEDIDINSITSVNSTGFTGDDLTYFGCSGWYESDENHTVIPNDYVYFAKNLAGEVAAFEISNYYDNQGNSGAFTINWKMFQ